MTVKLTVWELRATSKIITKVLRLQIIHLYNSTLTLCIWYYQAVLLILLLLNDAHYKSDCILLAIDALYKSDCILLAIFREMLNKSYFKLLAYVPTLPRLLILHKTLQRFPWNIVNITEIQERCSAAWCVCCTSDAGVALTTLRGTRQVARVSFTAKSYRFVSIFSYLYRCIVSYTKYRDAPIYWCIISPLVLNTRIVTKSLIDFMLAAWSTPGYQGLKEQKHRSFSKVSLGSVSWCSLWPTFLHGKFQAEILFKTHVACLQSCSHCLPIFQILWRKWVHWSDGSSHQEASIGSLWLESRGVGCQRPATVWNSRQLCSLHCNSGATWSHHGPGPAGWRTSFPRLLYTQQENLCHLHIFWVHALQAGSEDGSDRLWQTGRERASL